MTIYKLKGSLLRNAVLLIACSFASKATAHEGPPFPLELDQPVAGYSVSVWADPDIGEARFFVIVESESGEMPSVVPEVQLWVEPIDSRLPKVSVPIDRQKLKGSLQFLSKPFFDRQDHWNVGIRVIRPDGSSSELVSVVESTPPGYGPWDLAIYLFPFALIGGVWCVAIARRVRHMNDDQFSEVDHVPSDNLPNTGTVIDCE
ncbi:hypothetical protein LOC67_01195 [Stieleria sp. JC731]|uniref:hypothetical protein n=1 Tax=Pirellulaceae TaxID=2691357 RepID=UPI001E309261|nr:hypothetical protein [Stieleria sp. JC731]MCC9599157.1 hypothetical protein [Stieleria sp. JC731]